MVRGWSNVGIATEIEIIRNRKCLDEHTGFLEALNRELYCFGGADIVVHATLSISDRKCFSVDRKGLIRSFLPCVEGIIFT